MSSRYFDRLQNRPTGAELARWGNEKRDITAGCPLGARLREASAVGQEKSKAFSVNILNTHIKIYPAGLDKRAFFKSSKHFTVGEDHLLADVFLKINKQIGTDEPFWLLGRRWNCCLGARCRSGK